MYANNISRAKGLADNEESDEKGDRHKKRRLSDRKATRKLHSAYREAGQIAKKKFTFFKV